VVRACPADIGFSIFRSARVGRRAAPPPPRLHRQAVRSPVADIQLVIADPAVTVVQRTDAHI